MLYYSSKDVNMTQYKQSLNELYCECDLDTGGNGCQSFV